MFAITCGLNHSAVMRLKNSRQRLPPKYTKLLEELTQVIVPDRNFSRYRNLISNASVSPTYFYHICSPKNWKWKCVKKTSMCQFHFPGFLEPSQNTVLPSALPVSYLWNREPRKVLNSTKLILNYWSFSINLVSFIPLIFIIDNFGCNLLYYIALSE